MPKPVILLLFFFFLALSVFAACTGDDGDGRGDDDDDNNDDDTGDDDSGDDDDQNQPPTIDHTPLGDQGAGFGAYTVNATIQDDGAVEGATCRYRFNYAGDFVPLVMTGNGDLFTATIPEQQDVGLMEYYLSATDDEDATSTLPADAPDTVFAFRVLPAMEIIDDDGTAEDAIRGVSVGCQVLLEVTPVVYPVRLARVQFYVFPDPVSIGKSFRANVYANPGGAGPAHENLMFTTDAFTVAQTGDFIELDLSTADADFESGSFFIGIENLDIKGPWIGLDTSGDYLGASWYYDAGSDSFFNLADTEYAFNVMIRTIVILP